MIEGPHASCRPLAERARTCDRVVCILPEHSEAAAERPSGRAILPPEWVLPYWYAYCWSPHDEPPGAFLGKHPPGPLAARTLSHQYYRRGAGVAWAGPDTSLDPAAPGRGAGPGPRAMIIRPRPGRWEAGYPAGGSSAQAQRRAQQAERALGRSLHFAIQREAARKPSYQ